VLIALACSEAGEAPAGGGREPLDVVLVTWDTVRWDHVGTGASEEVGPDPAPSHTPTWDRFAREGIRFTEARTPAPVTLSAHASILTGLDPPRHGARDNGIFALRATVPTLAEDFARAGYLTAAFVSAEVLHPRHGLDRGFERYDYFVHRAERERTVPERRGDKTVDTALAWLASAPVERPLFLWVHLFDPHRVWKAPAPWSDRYDPYLAEIAFADAQTARLLDQLAGFGRLQRSLVVITSDHGEALGEHDEISHSYFAYDSTLRVPLLLWAGAKTGISLAAGERIDGPVSLVDLAPTLRALAGLPGRPTDGRSLVPYLAGEPTAERLLPFESVTPAIAYGTAPIFGVLTPQLEVWLDLPRRERFDIGRDPGQLENLYRAEDEPLADSLFARFPRDWPPSGDTLDLDPATRESLAALGYVIGSAASLGGDSTVDPKDLVDLHRFIGGHHSLRNPRRLLPEVRALRAEHGPTPALARFEIDLLVWLGRPRDALELVREAALANPDHPQLQQELRLVEGQFEAKETQIRAIREKLERSPGDPKLRRALATLLHGLQKHREAEVLYREVLADDPDNRDAAMNLVILLVAQERDEEAIAGIRAFRSKPGYEARYDCLAGDMLATVLGQLEEGRDAIRDCEARGGELGELHRAVLDGRFEGLED
jgi:arylsulfatase A-like enzyme/thioredoxin-like negative regulator of GroEL